MAPVREIAGLRLLRPLLAVPKERLLATLRAAGQAWLEDPSNQSPQFARSRLRQSPLGPSSADAAARAEARAALDRRTAAWLAAVARIDPAGFVTWPRAGARPGAVGDRAARPAAGAGWRSAAAPIRRAATASIACSRRCWHPTAAGRTLAGCRLLPWRDDLLICREPAAIAPPLRLTPNVGHHWDQRFLARWPARGDAGPPPIVRALGADGWRLCKAQAPRGALRDLPPAVRAGLASVWREDRLLAVAGLGPIGPTAGRPAVTLRFRPQRPLAGAPFVALRLASAPAPYLRIAHDDTFASI